MMNTTTAGQETASASVPLITVDGPSGSGKGLLSAKLARHTGWQVLDSGALYRLVALSALQAELSLEDEAGLERISLNLDASFSPGDDGIDVCLHGEPVAQKLRHEDVGAMASKVAAMGVVRAALLQRQRDYWQLPGLIADGRDMGTVVFPQAKLKVFLTASAEERARRRYNQLMAKGENVNFSGLLREIEARDERDQNRALAPLKPADDAILIDSTANSPEQVFAQVCQLLVEKQLFTENV
jgi:cytidylate kinase